MKKFLIVLAILLTLICIIFTRNYMLRKKIIRQVDSFCYCYDGKLTDNNIDKFKSTSLEIRNISSKMAYYDKHQMRQLLGALEIQSNFISGQKTWTDNFPEKKEKIEINTRLDAPQFNEKVRSIAAEI